MPPTLRPSLSLVLVLALALVRPSVAQFAPHGCHTCMACEWQCGIQCGGPQNIGHWQCSAAPTLDVQCACALPAGAVAAIVFSCLGLAALVAVLAWCYQRHRQRRAGTTLSDGEVLAPNAPATSSAYSYSAVSMSVRAGDEDAAKR